MPASPPHSPPSPPQHAGAAAAGAANAEGTAEPATPVQKQQHVAVDMTPKSPSPRSRETDFDRAVRMQVELRVQMELRRLRKSSRGAVEDELARKDAALGVAKARIAALELKNARLVRLCFPTLCTLCVLPSAAPD